MSKGAFLLIDINLYQIGFVCQRFFGHNMIKGFFDGGIRRGRTESIAFPVRLRGGRDGTSYKGDRIKKNNRSFFGKVGTNRHKTLDFGNSAILK